MTQSTTLMMEEKIIDPVPVDLIEKELTPDRFLRKTNKGGNEIYIVNAFNAPNVMREIGRLREIAFRTAGGGTGKDCDIDSFDTMNPPCQQLLVWDPSDKLILGGYRFITGDQIKMNPAVSRGTFLANTCLPHWNWDVRSCATNTSPHASE